MCYSENDPYIVVITPGSIWLAYPAGFLNSFKLLAL